MVEHEEENFGAPHIKHNINNGKMFAIIDWS